MLHLSKCNVMLLLNRVVEPQILLPTSQAAYFHALCTPIYKFANGQFSINNAWIQWSGVGIAKINSFDQFKQTLMFHPIFYWKSFITNIRWQQKIPAQVTEVPAECRGYLVSLLAWTEEAQNVATQTLQQKSLLQLQKMLMMETFFIFLGRQLFDWTGNQVYKHNQYWCNMTL